MRHLFAFSFVLVASCQPALEQPEQPSAGPPTGGCAATEAASCLQDQMACAATSAGPSCQVCNNHYYADATGTCVRVEGKPVIHDFPEQTIAAGGEQGSICRSWTLNNEEELWVGAVELVQNEQSHHSNWTWAADDKFDGPDGIWVCGSRNYGFFEGGAAGGVLFAQSTQASHEVEHFPPGAGFRLPPHVRIISDIHLLNASSKSVTGHSQLILYTHPAAEITTQLHVSHLEYDAINIAPHTQARLTSNCSVAKQASEATGKPYGGKVYYALPHTHTLATSYKLGILGGPHDGEKLLELGGYNGVAHGRPFDPPIDFTGANGFSLTCEYDNTRDIAVHWGIGTDEMCEGFVWTDSSVFFESRVSYGIDEGMDGTTRVFDGPCDTVIVSH
jgi:hypothetical protein